MKFGTRFLCLTLTALLVVVFAGHAHAGDDWVRVVSPAPGEEVVAKKPEIKLEFTTPVKTDTLMVTLDGVDVTQVGSVSAGGFEYTPVLALPPGQHTIAVTAEDSSGTRQTSQASFTSRQTGLFEEAYSNNNISVIHTTALAKSHSLTSAPYWKVEGNIASDSKIKQDGFELSFTTNVRYLEQGTPLAPPQQSKPNTFPISKGFNVANWLLQGGYKKDKFSVHASMGDVVVTETPYTVTGLARRGGTLDIAYDMFYAGAFSVKGEQVYGFRGGTGIDPSSDSQISGVAAGVKLPDNKAELKGVYASGSEPASSFGVTTTQGHKKGNVTGVMLLTDLLQGKLNTDCELDFSNFDPDDSDSIPRQSDHAYRLKAGGYVNTYSYDVMYEYIGKDYVSIGNQQLARDRRGVTANAGGTMGVHSAAAMFSWYENNVENDPLTDKIRNYTGSLNYSFMKFPTLPMGLGYTKTVQDEGMHPANTAEKEFGTDTVNGWINYTWEKLNVGLMSSYSELNDRTKAGEDTTAINYTVTSSYNDTGFSVSPSFMLSQSKRHVTNVWTDIYTFNLDTRTKFLQDKGAFDVGCSYVLTETSDDSAYNRNLNLRFRLSYALKELEHLMRGYVKPAVAITGTYTNFDDELKGGVDKDEYVIYLELTTAIPLSI